MKSITFFQLLFDDIPERLKISHGGEASSASSSFSLLADSESALNELIDCLRPSWRKFHATELEVINTSTTDDDGDID